MSTPKKLVVIDGKSVFYRGYYGMPNLSLPDGTPTGGVYGFAVLGLEIIKKMQPDFVVVAWDKSKTNIRSRKKLYPEYKANRSPMPDDMRAQIPFVRQLLDAFSWDLLECDDYEADDIMGTLAKTEYAKDKTETILVTSDLDLLQCVNDHTTVAALKKGLTNVEYYDPAKFREKYKVTAEQFIDIKALKGDSSDNIPGVKGVGEKTAVKLIDEYHSLEGVYEHIDEIKGALKTKLETDKEMAFLSRKLVTIMLDAPVELDRKKARVEDVDPQAVRDFFEEFRFRSLINQIPDSWKPTQKEKQAAELKTDMTVHQGAPSKIGEQIAVHVHGDWLWLSPSAEDVYVVNAADISELPKIKSLIGHDVKESLKVLLTHGVDYEGVVHDTRIGAFLINSLIREQSFESLIGGPVDEDNPAQVMTAIWQLYESQQKELNELPKVKEVAETMEWPLLPVLAQMEFDGVKLDTDYLATMSNTLGDQIADVEQEIYGLADKEFNLNSPSQLADVLYGTLNLPTDFIKKTKSGFSTAASELEKLQELHPIIDLVFKYREWSKLKSTYVDALPKLVDENSRLHTNYALDVAPTGRLSSHDPNLQNIPIKSELGRTIRKAFKPAKGNVFISADYSQFELRLAAALAEETEMIEAFNKGLDVHAQTAARIYDVEPDKITKKQRIGAKAVNFGIMYGQGPHGLSQATGMTMAESKKFIEKYFEIRPNIKKYLQEVKRQAKEDGYVETLYGRRRPTPDVKSSNFMVREGAYRAAINMPMQGTAADIMKLAMIELAQKLPHSARMLLQIHDSVLIEVPRTEAEKVAKQAQKIMEAVNTDLPVKLAVDYSIGVDWSEI